ncbi:MAG: hypothetical protein ABSE62_04955 [Chthoniobacteraceae bacterium]|jgi:hypothetical protein
MQNQKALKLPDGLLVRYYRDGKIERVRKVVQDKKTLGVTVTLEDGTVEKWKHVSDWIPDLD